jgi:S1-C subfamily serine protease
VPDYAHQGEGVRAESIVPGSPAARAGMQAGDILLSLDRQAINDLAAFSQVLKRYKAGDTVAAQVRRGRNVSALTLELSER